MKKYNVWTPRNRDGEMLQKSSQVRTQWIEIERSLQ